MAIPRPRMHLRYAQPRIPVYLSRAKDIKDAFEVCSTPDPCLVVEGQRHTRFPGVPRTKSSILLTIRIHQIWWRVTGLLSYPQHWMLLTPSQGGGFLFILVVLFYSFLKICVSLISMQLSSLTCNMHATTIYSSVALL
jgi:hypothetical protein